MDSGERHCQNCLPHLSFYLLGFLTHACAPNLHKWMWPYGSICLIAKIDFKPEIFVPQPPKSWGYTPVTILLGFGLSSAIEDLPRSRALSPQLIKTLTVWLTEFVFPRNLPVSSNYLMSSPFLSHCELLGAVSVDCFREEGLGLPILEGNFKKAPPFWRCFSGKMKVWKDAYFFSLHSDHSLLFVGGFFCWLFIFLLCCLNM